MRSLQELYEVTENLSEDLTLYCHFADCEPIVFEEAVKQEKWRIAMDEEIKSIKRMALGSWQPCRKVKSPLV